MGSSLMVEATASCISKSRPVAEGLLASSTTDAPSSARSNEGPYVDSRVKNIAPYPPTTDAQPSARSNEGPDVDSRVKNIAPYSATTVEQPFARSNEGPSAASLVRNINAYAPSTSHHSKESMFGKPPSSSLGFAASKRAAQIRSDSDSSDSDYVPERREERNSTSASSNDNGDSSDEVDIQRHITDVVESSRSDASNTDRKRKRKKIADPTTWTQNARTSARRAGKAYVSTAGKKVSSRTPIPVDCSKCRKLCSSALTEEDRTRICTEYYRPADYNRQKDFLLRRVQSSDVKQRTVSGQPQRQRSRSYRFSFIDANGETVSVCKKFFLATLGMTSDSAIRSAYLAVGEQGTFSGLDGRGRKPTVNKFSDEEVERAKRHITSFPTVEAHYVRKYTTKQYLLPGLNRTKLYELFKEWTPQNGVQRIMGKQRYLQILDSSFNLGFFVPKKDQCKVCAGREELSGDELLKYNREIVEPHLERHKDAQAAKAEDKIKSTEDKSIVSVTMDLQSVLHTPCSAVSVMFYKRKLSVYNLTIYEQAFPHVGACYLWDETVAKRGASEIGSCVLKHITSLPADVRHLVIYSDTCAGQNRNHHLASLLLLAVAQHGIEIIDQKFLESGHSYMEVDSMHAAIEFAKKHQKVYTPAEWHKVIIGARRCRPYRIIEMGRKDIFDLKALSAALAPPGFAKVNTEGQRVSWLKMKWIRYRKDCPGSLFYKEGFGPDGFKEIIVTPPRAGRQRLSVHSAQLEQLYNRPLPISDRKHKDLMDLVRDGAIPDRYRSYYAAIYHSSHTIDRLPEPDVGEDSGEDA